MENTIKKNQQNFAVQNNIAGLAPGQRAARLWWMAWLSLSFLYRRWPGNLNSAVCCSSALGA
jgi:hypothetical protein